MAQIRLQPPDPFNFKTPDDWPRWQKRFEQFRVASGLKGDPSEKQVSTLLYCLGEEAENVLASTNITDKEKNDYDTVLLKFNSFFKIRKNVIFERARFNRQKGESAEQYIMELYKLAQSCEYGDLTTEMIRDRLVGISDRALSERLQLDADLTLEKAKKMVRQREAVHEQELELNKPGESMTLAEVHRPGPTKKGFSKKPRVFGSKANAKQSYKPQQKQCSRCGKGSHPYDKCPAKEAICHCCKKKGHYSSQCFTKSISEISEECHLDTAFLDTVVTNQATSWTTKIQLNGQETHFKLDTGAEVTAISRQTLMSLGKQKLDKPEKNLYGPSRTPLQVIGQFTAKLSRGENTITQPVYVVDGLKTNLLGLPAITQLNLAARVDAIANIQTDIQQQFSPIFKGLGNLGGEYTIKLKPGAKPYSLFTPRHVPLPLRPKVKEELEKMESMGVISRVDEPTEWCAGMVVVPKRGGDIRICVDLKPLNTSVLREVHPLPKVDETLAQLSGGKVFSKLDANSGFWQNL